MQSMSDLALAQSMHRERMAFATVPRKRRGLAVVPRQRVALGALIRRLSPLMVPRTAFGGVPLQPEERDRQRPAIRLHGVILDCSDAVVLAEFYRALIGGEVHPHGPQDADLEVEGQLLSFHGVADYEYPRWPEGHPESLRLDLAVAEFASPHSLVTDLGGLPLDPLDPPAADDHVECRVYADPAGHAFSLCLA